MTTLPRRRKDTRPAELLDAALDVFAEKGFAAARMEDIAARAGAAKGTLYLYFPSKEAVFEALVRTLIVPNLDRAEAVAGRAYAGRWRRCCGSAAPVLAAIIRDGRLVVLPRLLIGELHKFPELARFYKDDGGRPGLGADRPPAPPRRRRRASSGRRTARPWPGWSWPRC